MLLEITQRRVQSDITILELSGTFALGRESQRIETVVDELLKQGSKRVVLDLVRIDYIDSAGIGLVALTAGKLKRAGCNLALAVPEGRVLQLLQLTQMTTVVTACPTVDAAVAAV